MTQVGADYDRWLRRSLSGRLYGLLTTLPGQILVNTPGFGLDKELRLTPESRILDIGCGSGALLQVIAARVRFQRAPVGVDPSKEMLRKGRGRHGIRLLQASGGDLPFADGTFDAVICAHVVKHLQDADLLQLLREVRRVLAPGGVALIWEFAPSGSRLLDRWNRWLITLGIKECTLRRYRDLSALALEAGFDWVANAHLRPFLYPPVPRVSLILGKAPPGWTPPQASARIEE
ncbi:MAG TPA: class I SAM-dependent methyltransferase [Dehalococcoidia bacterium]|nr:class I SAM-dependent methyltransferase [Dehalococcoidia bacterium]